MVERKITLEAASIDEALIEASKQWKIPVEDLHAKVISEEPAEKRGGFLGLFGGRKAEKKLTVEVSCLTKSDLLSRGVDFVNEVLKLMDFQAECVAAEGNTLDIQGEDAADYVVGHYGDAVRGMEYLVNLALRDPKSEPRLKVDSCGYRERRAKSLERLAEATARQAVKFGRPIRLDPMASWERWVIHSTLKDHGDVTTESIGEPPMRKVVVMPKYDPDNVRMPGPATMRVRAQREMTERNERERRNNSPSSSRRRFRR